MGCHAATAWRSARVSRPRRLALGAGLPTPPTGARRGSPDPAGLPDRQVSRAHRRPRFQRCSCSLSLLQTKETYRSSIWAGSGDPRPARVRASGGVRRPAPSVGAYQGGAQQTTAQHQNAQARVDVSQPRRRLAPSLARRVNRSPTVSRVTEFVPFALTFTSISGTASPRRLKNRAGLSFSIARFVAYRRMSR
jgi:hypothetical protein